MPQDRSLHGQSLPAIGGSRWLAAEQPEALVLLVGQIDDVAILSARERLSLAEKVRLVGHVPLAEAVERLEGQGRLDVIWLAVSEPIDATLASQLTTAAERLKAAIVCEAEGAALDAAFAAFADVPGVQFLAQPDLVACNLALAAVRNAPVPHVADSATSSAMERIDRLQDEVARISAMLATLAAREAAEPVRSGPVSFAPMVRASERAYRAESELAAFGLSNLSVAPAPAPASSALVRRILRQRRVREQFFPADMFADPAWDMLLDLYAAQLEGHPVAVSSLCIAAAVPATTALRWIKTMTECGLFERQADPRDGRRIFIALSPAASAGMERYFAAVAAMRD